MVTEIQSPPQAEPGLKLYRLSVQQFEKMLEAGLFLEGPRVELVGGALLERMTKHQPHNYVVGGLADLLRGVIPPGWFVSEEKSSEIDPWSRPEPDIAVIRGKRSDYRERPPQAKQHGLIIEVADTTYQKDKGVMMWRRYAAARIPCYWIVNLPLKQIEVYSDPSGKGKAAGYRTAVTYGPQDQVPVVLDGRELGRIAVRDVLP